LRYDTEREHSSHGTAGLTYKGQPDIELGLKILKALYGSYRQVMIRRGFGRCLVPCLSSCL
jgi:hypothetical protein